MTLFLRFSVACALFDRRPRPRHARLDVAMLAIARLCRLAAIGPFLLRKMFAGAFQHRPANGRRRIDGGLGLFPPRRRESTERAVLADLGCTNANDRAAGARLLLS